MRTPVLREREYPVTVLAEVSCSLTCDVKVHIGLAGPKLISSSLIVSVCYVEIAMDHCFN